MKQIKLMLEDRLKVFVDKGFSYNPIDGTIRTNNGLICDKKNNKGYIQIGCYYKDNPGKGHTITLKGHQLAYYITYGIVPNIIDHKDGDRTNNRIDNLRNVTPLKNSYNRLDVKGFCYNKINKRFQSYIDFNGKRKNLGCFTNEEEARQAYLDAKKIYHKL